MFSFSFPNNILLVCALCPITWDTNSKDIDFIYICFQLIFFFRFFKRLVHLVYSCICVLVLLYIIYFYRKMVIAGYTIWLYTYRIYVYIVPFFLFILYFIEYDTPLQLIVKMCDISFWINFGFFFSILTLKWLSLANCTLSTENKEYYNTSFVYNIGIYIAI